MAALACVDPLFAQNCHKGRGLVARDGFGSKGHLGDAAFEEDALRIDVMEPAQIGGPEVEGLPSPDVPVMDEIETRALRSEAQMVDVTLHHLGRGTERGKSIQQAAVEGGQASLAARQHVRRNMQPDGSCRHRWTSVATAKAASIMRWVPTVNSSGQG